ncbi:MAG: DUF4197 domain-containing protein [Halothiobacillus sp.]|jgi:hypothetical protein|nr:DUF4197 domain-containing protein [Halothiobacillus sp.]
MNQRTLITLVLFGSIFACSSARADFASDMLNQLGGMIDKPNPAPGTAPRSTYGSSSAMSGVSRGEMDQGVKEALSKGVRTAIRQLGRNGGFLNDPSVRIPMPGTLGRVEGLLRSLHQERLADEFVDTMNHAAEQAVPQAAAVFSDAIRRMSVHDVEGILRGPDDAATQYFQRTSQAQLLRRFRPIVTAATNKAGVTSAYKSMMDQAGPMARMLGGETDLDSYVTQEALKGLFTKIAEEEKAIRTNPVARSTDLLKKVFGSYQAR